LSASTSLAIGGNIGGGTSGDGTTGFLIKTGPGALILSGNNSLTGGLSIHAGSIELDSNTAASVSSDTIYVGDGSVDNQLATLVIGASGLNISNPIQTNVEQAFNN